MAIADTLLSVGQNLLNGVGSALINEAFAGKQVARQKDLADYSNQLSEQLSKELYDYQNQFNQYANSRSQMADAGLNPAIMYGGSMDKPALSGQSTSIPNSVANQPFKSVDPNEGLSLALAREKQNNDNKQTESLLRRQAFQNAKDAAETLRLNQDAHLRHKLNNVIYDSAIADLDYTKAVTDSVKLDKFVKGSTIGVNESTSAYYDALATKVGVDIQHLPAKYRADIHQAMELAKYYDEKAKSEEKGRELTDKEIEFYNQRIQNLTEDLYSGEVSRIAGMFGLQARRKNWTAIQSNMRELDILGNDARANGFISALMRTGHFTRDDAIAVYMFYTAENPKDVTPAAFNSVAKVLSK